MSNEARLFVVLSFCLWLLTFIQLRVMQADILNGEYINQLNKPVEPLPKLLNCYFEPYAYGGHITQVVTHESAIEFIDEMMPLSKSVIGICGERR